MVTVAACELKFMEIVQKEGQEVLFCSIIYLCIYKYWVMILLCESVCTEADPLTQGDFTL